MSRSFLLLAMLATGCGPTAIVLDDSTDVDRPDSEDSGFADRIDIGNLLGHLDALQQIADDNDSTRVSGTTGYDQSVEYVRTTLQQAGYDVQLDSYEVTDWDFRTATLESALDPDFEVLTYSGGGVASGVLTAVDVMLPPGAENSSTSGCESGDFSEFPTGGIALIQRGSCTFATKVANAESAGAVGVVIFNEGQSGRRGVVEGVLDEQTPSSIPVIAVSFATGEAWAQSADPVSVDFEVVATHTVTVEHNVIAELEGKNPDRVLMVGAHLDSVSAGAGINDNGSGTALVLEAAIQMAAHEEQPDRTVRFAWWGAEETGLIGSWHWVHDEATGEPDMERLQNLDAYLNFDMLASGNGLAFVSDGDASDINDGGANAGSAAIEGLFLDYFDDRQLPTRAEGLYIPSDSWWFVDLGIPTGHIFSGAFGAKSSDEAIDFGGQQGQDYDPCYHAPCDDTEHIDVDLYEQLAQASAHAIGELAWSIEPLGDSSNARGLRHTDRPRPFGCHEHVRWDR